MISTEDIAYIAGLFDEGSIHFKRGPEKKKKHKGKGYNLNIQDIDGDNHD